MTDTAFGLWLKQRRRALDLTQEDLAMRVGYAADTIRKYEAGTRRPSRALTEQLSEALELTPAERQAFLRMARQVEPPTPSPATPAAAPAGLPTPPTPFVGRLAELEQLVRLLADPDCRLITLTGPGGVGKTRLALQAAARTAGHVAFVPLAPVASADVLVQAIASALDISLYGASDPRLQLPQLLHERYLLLVLDNMEHLLAGPAFDEGAAVDLLAAILEQAPGVKLLVTSRERLRLHGEWQFEIKGLPVPAPDQAGQPGESAAVQLFLQQARRARSDFAPSADDWPAITRICGMLDGLPLAIELAAAWVRALSCAEIAQEIEQSLDFLSGASRDLPARHRSPRAVFDHSWNLLGEDERRALRRLAIFRGGFTRAAAAAVCAELRIENEELRIAAQQPLLNSSFSILNLLSSLIDKSLLSHSSGGRYQMHELIRQGAEERLKADPEEYNSARDRHSAFYAAWVQERQHALRSAGQAAAVAQINDEIDNVRHAISWALSRDRLADLRQSMRALCWFYELRGWLREGATLFGQIVAALQRADHAGDATAAERAITLGQSLTGLGWFRFRQGKLDTARELLRESVALLRSQNAPWPLAEALAFRGFVAYMSGQYVEAREYLEEGLALSQAIGDRWMLLFCQSDLGKVAYQLGEHQKAQQLLSEMIDAWRTIGDARALACTVTAYGPVASTLGRYDEALQLIREALAAGDHQYDNWSRGTALDQLGALAHARGDYQQALDLLCESVKLFRVIDDGWHLALALNHLGHTNLTLGRSNQARRCFQEALDLALAYQMPPTALEALEALAEISGAAGAVERALEVLAFVANHPASSAEVRERAARQRCVTGADLAPRLAEAAWQHGRNLTLATATTLAREPDWLELRMGIGSFARAT